VLALEFMQTTEQHHFLSAKPTRLGTAFWGRWFERDVRRMFSVVKVAGDQVLEPWTRGGRTMEPLILCCTHASWWDAPVTIALSIRHFEFDGRGMMEYRQLRRYPFFRSVGMFSVVREHPRSALRSISYAAGELSGTSRVLWMFPQGRLIPQHVRPIIAEPGIALLVKKLGSVKVACLGLHYDMTASERPSVWARFDSVETVEWTGVAATIQDKIGHRLTHLADHIAMDVSAGDADDYHDVFRARPTFIERYDTIVHRAQVRQQR